MNKNEISLRPLGPGPHNVHIRNLAKTYKLMPGEDAKRALLRVFHEVCNKILLFKTQKEYQIEGEEGDYQGEFMERIKLMVFAHMIPITANPMFNAVVAFPAPTDRPGYLIRFIKEWTFKMRKYYPTPFCQCAHDPPARTVGYFAKYHETQCLARSVSRREEGNPYYYAGGAFVSGATEEGLWESLNNIGLNARTPQVPVNQTKKQFVNDVIICLADIYAKSKPAMPLNPPTFSRQTIQSIPFDPDKSAGYFNVYESVIKNITDDVVKLANTTDQGMAHSVAVNQIVCMANDVRKAISGSKKYSRDWFPNLVAKIAVKPEVRDPDASETKTRVFFIMCFIKLLIDKNIYKAPFECFYQRDFCAIGHVWAGGGAERVAQKMHANDPDWAWMDTDVSKLDQRLMPGLLTIIFTSLLAFYRDDPAVREDYEVLRAFMVYSADDIAATIIKWIGLEYRIIVGVMFSGLFGTSWGDTVYVALCIKTAMRNFIRLFVDGKVPEPAVLVYGDNILMGWRRDYLRAFVLGGKYMDSTEPEIHPTADDIKDGYFARYLSRTWGLPLKYEETGYHDFFYSKVKEYRDPDVGYTRTKLVKTGPIFLKRYFIKCEYGGDFWAMPFRPVIDYYVRSITTNHRSSTTAVWPARWCGLLLDTAGTNTEAYQFLRYLLGRWTHEFIKTSNKFDTADLFAGFVEEVPEYFRSRILKLGLDVPGLTTLITYQQNIAAKFAPPNKVTPY